MLHTPHIVIGPLLRIMSDPLPTFQKVDFKQDLVTCDTKQPFSVKPPLHRIQSVTPMLQIVTGSYSIQLV